MSNIPKVSEVDQPYYEVEKGIELGDTLTRFLEKKLQIEEEYAKSLMKLAKTSIIPPQNNVIGTLYDSIVQSTLEEATFILSMVSAGNADVVEALKTFFKGMRIEAKSNFNEGQKLLKERADVYDMLKKSKSIYEGGCKESDMDLTRLQYLEDDYKKQVAFTNRYHDIYHNDKIPRVQSELTKLETIRIQKIKTLTRKILQFHEEAQSKITSAIQKTSEIVDNLDAKVEIQTFSSLCKRVNVPLQDVVFEVKPGTLRRKAAQPSSSSSQDEGKQSLTSLFASNEKTPTPVSTPPLNKPPISTSPTAVFGVSIEDVMEKQKSKFPSYEVPAILITLTTLVRQLDGFSTEGIFRVPGVSAEIQNLKKLLDEGAEKIESTNVHTPASLLKLWMRELPEPLIPESMYEQCLNVNTADQALKTFSQLPSLNQKIITYVLQFLDELAQPENINKTLMNKDNLSMVFAPSFLRSSNLSAPNMLTDVEKGKSFVKLLIENVTKLGNVTLSPLSLNSPSPTSVWQKTSTADGKFYYYNTLTRETSWTNPEEVNLSIPPPLIIQDTKQALPENWAEYSTPEGRKYYHNKITNETSWVLPSTPTLPSLSPNLIPALLNIPPPLNINESNPVQTTQSSDVTPTPNRVVIAKPLGGNAKPLPLGAIMKGATLSLAEKKNARNSS